MPRRARIYLTDIELNPVGSGMVGVPEEYQRSSYTSNA
jgi:hypothetical protein